MIVMSIPPILILTKFKAGTSAVNCYNIMKYIALIDFIEQK